MIKYNSLIKYANESEIRKQVSHWFFANQK